MFDSILFYHALTPPSHVPSWEAAEAESNKDKETPDKTEYDYLLNMNLWSLTQLGMKGRCKA